MSFITITLVLFLIMDPVGNIAAYLKMVEGIPPKRSYYIIMREMCIALIAMIIFNFFGEVIFNLLQISETTVRLASGVILFLISLQILFPNQKGLRDNLPKEEPFIVPLAIPLIAGPSLLATIMLYARLEPSIWLMLGAILTAWAAAILVLLFSRSFYRILGTNGLMACEKLMGMILVMLAIQRFLDGIKQFTITLSP